MLNKKNYIYLLFSILIVFSLSISAKAEENFNDWLLQYKKFVLSKGVSQDTINATLSKAKFLKNVIKYDRKQPEFFEDTITYVSKRANSFRMKKAKLLLKENKELFVDVENNFSVEKELLLSLWGIETNFGKHVGKMDIISSLATLSFDKRRRDFFSEQLLILLILVDKKLIEPNTLFGSWAGAYGNFQFMPSTIKNYAIDYNGDNKIELKGTLDDSLASAANYIKKIGWKKGQPCFYRVKMSKKINKKYLNTSAREIKNRLDISQWKQKGVVRFNGENFNTNLKAALIIPDGKEDSPAYLVFSNYEKILKWNRSLRFGISVCTLKNMIKDE